MVVFIPAEVKSLEILAETYIIPSRKNQFSEGTFFDKTPVTRIAWAMNKNAGFCGSDTKNTFWYQQFDSIKTRKLKGGQPIVVFDAADNCCLYDTTMRAMKLPDKILLNPPDKV